MVQIFKIFYLRDNENATMRIVIFFLSLKFFLDTIMGIIKVKGICVDCHLLIHTSFHHWHTVIYRVDEIFIENLNDKSEQRKVDLQSGSSAFQSSFFHLLYNS